MLRGSCICGGTGWQFDAWPDSATICNCTVCRHYGTVWIYGHEGEDARLTGQTRIFKTSTGWLEFHFCPSCACILAWRAVHPEEDGRRRLAVNLRLSEDQDIIRPIPLDLFDGATTFEDLPRDGRRVGDLLV